MKYRLLHNIGHSPEPNNGRISSNYNTIEEVIKAQEGGDILTFDGVYKNVYEHRDAINWSGVLLFVVGNTIGGDNSFDRGMPHEEFCDLDELRELEERGAILCWHTWSHPDLTLMNAKGILQECAPPARFSYAFAYPYGKYNDEVKNVVKQCGFSEAYSVTATDGDNLTIKREYV